MSSTEILNLQGSGLIDVSTISTYVTYGGDLGTINGQSSNDTIKGFDFPSFSDTIFGAAGHDLINGMAGNDILLGGVGNDTLSGDTGNDTLSGDAGNDSLIGGAGNDTFRFMYKKKAREMIRLPTMLMAWTSSSCLARAAPSALPI